MPENYQLWLDRELSRLSAAGVRPRLLLHSCCAPCSSYVLEYLSRHFAITVFYYDPNISPAEEFYRRSAEQQRLICEMPLSSPVEFVEGRYEPERFFAIAAGHETDPEGGARCLACYRLRLTETAALAAAQGFAYFTTTLSISPLKNAAALNAIGRELAAEYGVPYLFSDFKKHDGYKRSCVLSREYDLYRQNYCGCVFSARAAQEKEDTEG